MGSWITCVCGALIHTNLFAGATAYRLISDADYDALDDPIDRDTVEALFFEKGIPVYRCRTCNRLVVRWDKQGKHLFYVPEGKTAEQRGHQRAKRASGRPAHERTGSYGRGRI
jgi:hypothetical protein